MRAAKTKDRGIDPTDPSTGGATGARTGRRPRWVVRRFAALLAIGALVALPLAIDSLFRLQVLMLAFTNAAAAVGLVVSFGYAGLLNLSQSTFVGIGGYVAANAVVHLGLPFEITILGSMAVAALAGVILGLTSLRVQGDYFSLVSIAFTLALSQVFANWKPVTRGGEGFYGIPGVSLLGMDIRPGVRAYYAGLLLLVLAMLIAWSLVRTFAGRAMLGVRYDTVAASANGVNVGTTRVAALAVSSAIAGAAGAFQVATIRFISPTDFDLISGFNIMVWVIIGGMTSLWGSAITAIAVTVVTEEFRQLATYRLVIYSVLVLVAVFARGGVFTDWARRWRSDARG